MTKTICLFNHKGGVSKTTTTFNLGWVLADLGKKVLMVDLDSQCNLTGLILDYQSTELDSFYGDKDNLTIKNVVNSLVNGGTAEHFIANNPGGLTKTKNKNLYLLPGHLDISELDSQISVALKISNAMPIMRNVPENLPNIIKKISEKIQADYILYDFSPNVGGVNEVILMSSDFFIVPTSPDYFCLQAIDSLTKNIIKWHREITDFKKGTTFTETNFPIKNQPKFLGVIQQRYRPRDGSPARAFQRWIDEISDAVSTKLVKELSGIGCVISKQKRSEVYHPSDNSFDLAQIPDFNSLIAISQELSKPIFAISESDLLSGGRLGKVLENMMVSKNNFAQKFNELGNRVIKLTD